MLVIRMLWLVRMYEAVILDQRLTNQERECYYDCDCFCVYYCENAAIEKDLCKKKVRKK